MGWEIAGALLSTALGLKQARDQKQEAKKLEKKEKKAKMIQEDVMARKASDKIMERNRGSSQSSYMGTYSPSSKTTLGG
jgi:hypothetical protein